MKTIRVKLGTDPATFESAVFGGWCILKNFPAILDTGIDLYEFTNGNFYIVENGKPVDRVYTFEASTCFFTPGEMKYLDIVEVK